MRISDWSSDVCSSDLAAAPPRGGEDDEGVVPGSPVCVVGQGQAVRSLAAPAAELAAAAFLALGAGRGRLAELADPGAAVLVVVHQHVGRHDAGQRSEEHTSELQSLMRISYAVFCLKKKKKPYNR